MTFAELDGEESTPRMPWTVLAFLAAPVVIVSAILGLFYTANVLLSGALPNEEARSSAFAISWRARRT